MQSSNSLRKHFFVPFNEREKFKFNGKLLCNNSHIIIFLFALLHYFLAF